ncbi:MAG: glycerophosphodiester phosphodiesterase family protein [Bacilli bacterium]|nr:glycerophosphodiester phosphodiesterase family protein [Bacilli bacterium]
MVKLISHRGNNNHEYKENTSDAILDSLKYDYIAGVEFDVRITRDNQIVIIHDMTISRASDGNGFVKDMTLKELQKYNFGNKKHKSLISKLSDVLNNINSNKIIMIEIKHESLFNKTIINKIYNIIKKYKYLNIYICSFNHNLIKEFKKKHPKIKAGLNLLISGNIGDTKGITFLCVNYQTSKQKNNRLERFLWTINNQNQFNKVRYYLNDADYIITDKAYKIKDII